MKNDELTIEKKAAIKKLLKVTNATQSSELAMNLFLKQIMETLKEHRDGINPGTFETDEILNSMKEEAKALIHEEIVAKESLHLLMYPIYHKHLTLEEINELIKVNEILLGQKMISIAPKIMQESMEVGQIWGQELNLKFQERMSKILKKGF